MARNDNREVVELLSGLRQFSLRLFNQEDYTQHRQKGYRRAEVKRRGGIDAIPQPAGDQTRGEQGEAGHTVIKSISRPPPIFGGKVGDESLTDALKSTKIETITGEEQ